MGYALRRYVRLSHSRLNLPLFDINPHIPEIEHNANQIHDLNTNEWSIFVNLKWHEGKMKLMNN